MATCQEWTEWFAAVMRWQRGVGPQPSDAPDGRPPEGCTYVPCPGDASINPMVSALVNKLNERDNLNATRPANCPRIKVRAVRSVAFNGITPGFETYAPAGGSCVAFASSLFYGQAWSCPIPDPPPPPPPAPVYSDPIAFLVEPTPNGGWSVTSSTNVWPSPAYFETVAGQANCICSLLDLIAIRLNNINLTQRASGLTRSDQQENFLAFIDSLGSLSRAIQSSLRVHAVATGGVQLDFAERPTVSVLNPGDLQPLT